jgi:hypothetical protein
MASGLAEPYRHVVRLLDDVLLRLPPEALDDVLALLGGALEPAGQLGGRLLSVGLHEVAAQGVSGHQDRAVEQALRNSATSGYDF